jgi:hypothetical protein
MGLVFITIFHMVFLDSNPKLEISINLMIGMLN